MDAQLGHVLNVAEDQEALESLQKIIGIVSKLAVDMEAEYMEARYGARRAA